jgi:hypothetical protein
MIRPDASTPQEDSVSDAPAGDPGLGDIAEAVEQTNDAGDASISETPEAPPRQYVEIDDPDNRFTRVRVADEDIEVPYSELVKGYSRTADYTRKTQELAQQRQEAEFGIQLQRALQSNPQATIRYLAEQAGLAIPAPQQPAAAEPEEEYADPLEREVRAERQARLVLEQRLNQREMDEHVERTVNGLRSQFNATDDDIRDVIQVAMANNYPVDALPMIYKAITLDKLQARVTAANAAKAERDAAETRRKAAAATASQVISQGTAGSNGLTNRTELQERPTFRQAALAAFDELERRP